MPLSGAATASVAPKHPIAAAKHSWRNFIAGKHGALFHRAKAQVQTIDNALYIPPLDDGASADEGEAGVNYGGPNYRVPRRVRNRCDLYEHCSFVPSESRGSG